MVAYTKVCAASKSHGEGIGIVHASGESADDRQADSCSQRGMSAAKQRMAEDCIFPKSRRHPGPKQIGVNSLVRRYRESGHTNGPGSAVSAGKIGGRPEVAVEVEVGL